jgi:heme/copper-type cytochrome/quinol oxidase subunit 4
MVLEIDDHAGRSSAYCGFLVARIAPSAIRGRARNAALGFATAQPRLQVAMSNFMSHIAVPVAIGAVAVVLLLGLYNMMRGGSANTSQKLMRLRVLLQFIAIIVIMATLWFMSK